MGLGDYVVATQMRDVMSALIKKEIQRERPRYEYAKVQSVERVSRKAYVRFEGEVTDTLVSFGHVIPTLKNQVVRVEGLNGDRYVADVMGKPALRVHSTYRGGEPGANINADTWGLAVDDEGIYPDGDDYRIQTVFGPDTIQTRQGRLGVTSPRPLYINPLFDFAVDDRINNRVMINNLVMGNWSQADTSSAVLYHKARANIADNVPGYQIRLVSDGGLILNAVTQITFQNQQADLMYLSKPFASYGRLLLPQCQLYVQKTTQSSWGEMAGVYESNAVGASAWSGISAYSVDGVNALMWAVNHNVVAWNARNSANTAWVPIKASAFTVSSSAEMKRDIATLDRLDITTRGQKLRPVRFKRPPSPCPHCLDGSIKSDCKACRGRDHRSAGTRKYEDTDFVGFIAEEVEPIFPEVCSYDGDGKVDGLDLGALSAVLMVMVQKHELDIANIKKGSILKP